MRWRGYYFPAAASCGALSSLCLETRPLRLGLCCLGAATMIQIVDLMFDGKRYKVVFPDEAPPRAYVMTRRGPFTLLGRGRCWRPELYDRVVKAARRTLAVPATQNMPTAPHA